MEKTTAIPVIEDGFLTGVTPDHNGTQEVITPMVKGVIADGSMNRFGRELGTRGGVGLPDGHGGPWLLRPPRSRIRSWRASST